MTHTIEARPYGPDSTPEEVAALRARVRLLEPLILHWDEIPVHTPFSLGVITDEIHRLMNEQTRPFGMLVELHAVRPPDAALRLLLRQVVTELVERSARVCVCTGSNPVIAVAARFVLGTALGFGRASVHASRESALEELRNVIGK